MIVASIKRQAVLTVAVLLGAASTGNAQSARPQGLGKGLGLGARPGMLATDPKISAVETELLSQANALRKNHRLPPLALDARAKGFARREAELAARGDPAAQSVHERVKSQGLAPYGYYLHFTYGKDGPAIMAAARDNQAFKDALRGEYGKVGIGAFLVPERIPYFQVAWIFTRVPDPMAGKPGLTQAQTDPIMAIATDKIRACYDTALGKSPNLAGKIIFEIVIGASGDVKRAKLVKSLKSESFGPCALAVVRDLRFPAPYKGKDVTLFNPMQFSPPQGSRRLGLLSPQQIRSAFSAARRDFKTCYDDRADKNPKLAGELNLKMTVQIDGKPAHVRIADDTLGDTALAKCILRRAQGLRFPRPEHGGEVDVSFPLQFQPSTKSKRR